MPLPALLGRVQHRYVTEFEARLGELGYPGLSLAHGANVLRHLGGGRVLSAAELVRRATITKQAMSQQVRYLVDQDVVRQEPSPGDARARPLRLTPKGEEALRTFLRVFAEMDAAWRARHGDDDIDHLERLLQRLWDA